MKTGIELIAKERQEQIEKHGYTVEHDVDVNGDITLIQVAIYCLDPTHEFLRYPKHWDEKYKHILRQKPRVERFAIAGAFIAAAIDTFNQPK